LRCRRLLIIVSATPKLRKSTQGELSLKHRRGTNRVTSSGFEHPRVGSPPFPQADSGIAGVPYSGASDSLNHELGVGPATSFPSPNALVAPAECGGRSVEPLLIYPSQPQPTSTWVSAASGHGVRYSRNVGDHKSRMQRLTNGESRVMGAFHAVGEGYARSNFQSNCYHIPAKFANQAPSIAPPLYPAAAMQDTSIPTRDIAQPRSHLGDSVVHVLGDQDVRSFDHASTQPVSISQQPADVRQLTLLGGNQNVVIREAGTQLKSHVPRYSHIPTTEPDGLDFHGSWDTGSTTAPLDHGRNLMGQGAPLCPRYIALSPEGRPGPGVSEGLTEARAELKSSSAPNAGSGRRCLPASSITIQSDTHAPSRHAAKDQQLSSGVRRTTSRRIKDAERPPYARRKPHAIYESNVGKLQDRCREDGGDEGAVNHLAEIFKDGVNPEALGRQMTEEEVNQQLFGVWRKRTQVYRVLLEQETEGSSVHHTCRLCRKGTRRPYRNAKDVLPHIKTCHVGFEGAKS
jgi:hypothetical protein